MSKRWLSTLLAVVLLAALVPQAFAEDYDARLEQCEENPAGHNFLPRTQQGAGDFQASPWISAGDEGHYYRIYHREESECEYCGVQIITGSNYRISDRESHIFVGEIGSRRCLICDHPDPTVYQIAASTEDGGTERLPVVYRDNGDGTHTSITYTYQRTRYLDETGMELYTLNTYVDSYITRNTSPHQFSGTNPTDPCIRCGVAHNASGCTHPDFITIPISDHLSCWDEIPGDDVNHYTYGNLTTVELCKTCGNVTQRTTDATSRQLFKERHVFRSEGGLCVFCNYNPNSITVTDCVLSVDEDPDEHDITPEMEAKGIDSVEALETALVTAAELTPAEGGDQITANYVLREVTVLVEDMGEHRLAEPEDFQNGGLIVKIPYPQELLDSGLDPMTLDFTIVHMYKDGTIDKPEVVARKEDGLLIRLHGASPVLVAWEEGTGNNVPPTIPTAPGGDSSTPPSTGDSTPLDVLTVLLCASLLGGGMLLGGRRKQQF